MPKSEQVVQTTDVVRAKILNVAREISGKLLLAEMAIELLCLLGLIDEAVCLLDKLMASGTPKRVKSNATLKAHDLIRSAHTRNVLIRWGQELESSQLWSEAAEMYDAANSGDHVIRMALKQAGITGIDLSDIPSQSELWKAIGDRYAAHKYYSLAIRAYTKGRWVDKLIEIGDLSIGRGDTESASHAYVAAYDILTRKHQ